MDWLQFTAAVIGHLAWPGVIVVLFVILRKHLGTLADRLLEFSFGGAKITFDKILQKGAEIIEETPPPQFPKPIEEPQLPLDPNAKTVSPNQTREEIAKRYVNRRRQRKDLLGKSAFGIVLSGLDEVDSLLFEIGDTMGIDAAAPSSVMYSLVGGGYLPESIGQLYDTLRDARNLLAHSNALPDDKEALEYARQTSFLKSALQNYKSMLPQVGRIEHNE
ncbi:hypothetical protein V1277_001224 [Bradyrhizobium sp. AZCC 1588]|uniref:hypothetical protein n=1 Tax=unclassified Bradyrhizobium TaxID=2631580 RepID=UPI002FEEDA03